MVCRISSAEFPIHQVFWRGRCHWCVTFRVRQFASDAVLLNQCSCYAGPGGSGYRANFYKVRAQLLRPALLVPFRAVWAELHAIRRSVLTRPAILIGKHRYQLPTVTILRFPCVSYRGCWSPVETPAPSFHQPKFFRPLKFDDKTAAPGRL